jgi:dihydrolipoyl dehydrogenase
VSVVEVKVPDIGDSKGVSVLEVLVAKGATIQVDDPLITLESEKASMDVPSPVAGVIESIAIKKGDHAAEGTLIATVTVNEGSATAGKPPASPQPPTPPQPTASPQPPAPAQPAASTTKAPVAAAAPAVSSAPAGALDLVVLGSGPGGYTAAFRAADLGLKVTLIERWPVLGGVCLNVGCIPSKALLHAAKVIEDAHDMAANGVSFGPPVIDFDKLRAWKNKVVGKLTNGLTGLAKQRKVEVVRGEAKFVGAHTLELQTTDGPRRLDFKQCIIAAGSESVQLPGFPDDPRIIDSTGALELPPDCKRLLVIGGGIIGLEMACVYDALRAKVSVVELLPQLMTGADPDLVRPLEKRIRARYAEVLVNTRVIAVTVAADGLQVSFQAADGTRSDKTYDHVLVAVGRSPNGGRIGADKAGVQVDARGFIGTDKQMRSNVRHIFAIGDVVGQPMLAHKATHEGKVAAEVAAGHKSFFDARVIPSVAYTDPEVAWVGLTETIARAERIEYEKTVFPWAASGRSLALGRDEGLTKLLFDPATRRVVGAGIVGSNAGELIAEVALAIEMGADGADIGLTVHAHPTLSETVAMASEAFEGTLTDLYMPKKR